MINLDASTPDTGYAGRSYYLSEELSKLGHKVYLIAGSFIHLHRNPPEITAPYMIRRESNFNLVWIKVGKYSNAHSKKRIWNWFYFAHKLKGLTDVIEDKPDVILCSSPPLVSFLGARYLSKFYNAKLIFEFRDIWPLTLIELGGFSKRHPFIKLMQWIEAKAYQESDWIISNLKNAHAHLERKQVDLRKFRWVPNGYSKDEVSDRIPIPSEIRQELPENKFIVGYTGTLGHANAMEIFIEAGKALHDHPDIVLVLVGDGKEKESLKQMADGYPNIIFIDPIHKKMIQSMLEVFDVCYIGWRNHSIYEFGIGANKIPDYLFSARPIIHSYSGKEDPIEEAGAGLKIPAENVVALVSAILHVYDMTDVKKAEMGKKGHDFAVQNFEYELITQRLEQIIQQ